MSSSFPPSRTGEKQREQLVELKGQLLARVSAAESHIAELLAERSDMQRDAERRMGELRHEQNSSMLLGDRLAAALSDRKSADEIHRQTEQVARREGTPPSALPYSHLPNEDCAAPTFLMRTSRLSPS